jgi:hypothetical protein
MARANTIVAEQKESLLDNYVFMDKVFNALEVAMKTEKNLVLFGPGGHGKSEYALEYLYEKNIYPYVITMGKGMSTDRLFGGLNVKEYEHSGKIEYLIENSFMNHEYVIFEEMMDAPDYILEQLKDILSSGQYRNGSQVFNIKTKFIVACTNKSREEFSKNDSLKALMERFPLELNVVWDNYTELAYKTLLEKRFGVNKVDPIIPFLLQEYTRNGITISPRIALDTYDIFEECGPDSLMFIAEFAKKPSLISESLAKFQDTIRFKQLGSEMQDIIEQLEAVPANRTPEQKVSFMENYRKLQTKLAEVKSMTINDEMAQEHAALKKIGQDNIDNFQGRYIAARDGEIPQANGEARQESKPKKKGYNYDKYANADSDPNF